MTELGLQVGNIGTSTSNNILYCGRRCVMDYRLQVVEDAVPGKQLNEVEERWQELIGASSSRVLDLTYVTV